MESLMLANQLSNHSAMQRLEEAIWSLFEAAAQKVGCPGRQVELYFEMVLDSCKPIEMQEDPHGWANQPPPKAVGPKAEKEVLRAHYRNALAELLGSLNSKTLEKNLTVIAAGLTFRRLTPSPV